MNPYQALSRSLVFILTAGLTANYVNHGSVWLCLILSASIAIFAYFGW